MNFNRILTEIFDCLKYLREVYLHFCTLVHFDISAVSRSDPLKLF